MTSNAADRKPPIDRAALHAPSAVVLVGASDKPGSVGHAVLANLVAARPQARLHAVNPHPIAVEGAAWCARIADLPEPCDLAVVAIPAPHVPEAIDALGARGTRVAVVITAGINDGNGLRPAMLEAAARHGMRIIGPNCLGALIPPARINGSFAPCDARPGHLAFLSQSGALTTAILDWAQARAIGFSAVLSVGDMADVDFGDLIELYAQDPDTHAILLYVEGIADAPRFLEAASAASRIKPVIAIKAGRSAAAGKAALSHTGALAGAYDVYRAAFRRAGIVMVETLGELFDAAAMLDGTSSLAGERLAIITNGGGAGILAVDSLDAVHGQLAELPEALVARLDEALPPGWSGANPIDIIGDAHADRYRAAIEAVLDDAAVDAVLVVNCPTALSPPLEIAEEVAAVVAESRAAGRAKPVFGCWLGDNNAARVRATFAEARVPLFETPADAIDGFAYLVQAHRNARAAAEEAAAAPVDESRRSEARALFAGVRADGRSLLSEIEAKRLLAIYGVPVVPTVPAASPAEVREACAGMTPPFVVKIVSPDITHKSDFGGVVLGLSDAEAAEAAAEAMEERLRARFPEARLTGFAVQPLIRRRNAHELFAGIATDPTFGSLVMFGAGGTAIEVLQDKAIELPPVDMARARKMIGRTRISRLLAGYRDRPAADLDAIAATICAVSEMAHALPELRELDINPFLVDAEGAIALDARVVISGE